MSSKLILTTSFGLIFGIGAMFFAQDLKPLSSKQRSPSSKPFQISKTFKHLLALTTRVEILDSSYGDVTRLKGTVTMNQPTDGTVRYSWILPEGTEIVSGALADTLVNPQINVPQTFEIEIRGFMGGSKKDVSFIAQMDKAGESPGSVAVITNQEENSLENLKANEFKLEKLRSAR